MTPGSEYISDATLQAAEALGNAIKRYKKGVDGPYVLKGKAHTLCRFSNALTCSLNPI
jgi:hypothetical protein